MLKIKLYTLTDEDATPKCIGTMKAAMEESLADLRKQFEEKKVLNFTFQFWDAQECCRLSEGLESMNNIESSVFMIPAIQEEDDSPAKRQRVSIETDIVDSRHSNDGEVEVLQVPEFPDLPNYDVPGMAPDLASCSRVSSFTEESFLESKLVTPEVLATYKDAEKKLRKTLKDVSLEDHDWFLKSYDDNGKAIVILYCLECKRDFGGTDGQHSKERISNLFSNFRKSHIMSNLHIRRWCSRKGVDWCNHPQSAVKGKKTVLLTAEDHRQLVLEGVKILEQVNDSLDSEVQTFELIGGDPHCTELKSFWWKAKCMTCNELYSLCPPKNNLEANLLNHAGGTKHAQKVLQAASSGRGSATSGKRGRPTKSGGNNSDGNQTQLHSFFGQAVHSLQVSTPQSMDQSNCKLLMCWGFRGPRTSYAGKSYEVSGLFFDIKPGQYWYPEPWLQETFVVDGICVNINGTFRHRSCLRVSTDNKPWSNLTCSMCGSIPSLTDFKLRVIREDKCLTKRGMRTTESGRRIGYLSLLELTSHSRSVSSKLRSERLLYRAAKLQIVQLKVKRPTLKESALAASSEHNVYKFCTQILAAHRSGAFGGRPALWNFL